jgi:hypothetical protein
MLQPHYASGAHSAQKRNDYKESSGGKSRPELKAEKLIVVYKTVVKKMWRPPQNFTGIILYL